MAGVSVEAGSAMAQAITGAVQPKLMENSWVAEENDTTLAEYVTMMIVNGKDLPGVKSELGGDLLGVGEDDPAVGAFAEWLFGQVRALSAPLQPASDVPADMAQEIQADDQAEDAVMDDATGADGVPSGPKAMRNGTGAGRGRGSRMLGQLNNHLNRDQNLPDGLRRIKGAAGGQGRINAHVNREPPRGPKNHSLANGLDRMMNGGGRGGRGGRGGAMGPGANPMVQANNMMSQIDPQSQMAFMQMMEMQANMMQQMLQTGQMPGMAQQTGPNGKSLFDRVDKRPNGHFKGARQPRNTDSQDGGDAASSGMDVDSKKEPFETVCRFNTNCTNPTCHFAHQSPAAPPGQTMDMTDTCSFGVACQNTKCSGRHPSPAQRTQHLKQEVDCKFFPNCTNPSCPFKHPDRPLCRNGADCQVTGCSFTHSKIMCRYTPCTKPFCPFKHVEGQRGVYKDKVWTADGVPDLEGEGQDGGTSNRFASLQGSDGQGEELILPGQQQKEGPEEGSNASIKQETQLVT